MPEVEHPVTNEKKNLVLRYSRRFAVLLRSGMVQAPHIFKTDVLGPRRLLRNFSTSLSGLSVTIYLG